MAAKKVTHRTKVEAAQSGFFQGSRNQHIANELRGAGIPAVAHKNGVGVERGTLDVYEEEGHRVFEWTDAEAAPVEAQPEAETSEVTEINTKSRKRAR